MENQFKKIRSKLSMTRKDFAKSLGITIGAIQNYEYGLRFPRPEICYRIIELAKKHKVKITLDDIYPR